MSFTDISVNIHDKALVKEVSNAFLILCERGRYPLYPAINILGLRVGTYSLCVLAGLFICCFLGIYLGKKRGVRYYQDIVLALIAVGIGLLIGGHLLFFFTIIGKIVAFIAATDGLTAKDALSLVFTAFGGNVFYGGLLGAIGALLLFTKLIKTIDRSDLFDIFAVCVPLFHAFGRVGCFFGGCCFGIECSIGFTAHGNEIVPMLNDVNRFPVQLLEAFLNLCIFVLILSFFMKQRYKGELLVVYLFLYSIVRFFDEFLRGDEMRGRFLCFSTSQWISIFIFAFVMVYITYIRPKKKRTKETIS